MTFTKRKSASKNAADKPKKLRVVSVRLTEEEYQQVVENCRKAGRKLSDFWRRALLNAKITALATPEDMAIALCRFRYGRGGTLCQGERD